MRSIVLVLSMILTTSPSIAGAQPTLSPVILKLLNVHNSKVKWSQMLGQADVNCDGVEDYIFKGRAGARLYIAVVIGPLTQTSKVNSVNIGLGNEKYQDSLLEQNPPIKIVPLDYNPKEMSGFIVEGFQRSKKCRGIEVGGEESDEINIYWNHQQDKLDWWRL